MRKIWSAIAEASSARLYGVVTGLASLVITARILGPDGRGVMAASVAWATLIAAFAGLSLGQVTQHHIQGRTKSEWLPRALGTLVPCLIVSTLVAVVVVQLSYELSGGEVFGGISRSILCFALVMVPLLIWEEYSNNMLAAAEMLRQANLAQFIGRTVQIALVLLLVWVERKGVEGALLGLIIGQAVVASITFTQLWKGAGYRLRFNREDCKSLLAGAVRLHLNTVGAFVLGNATVLILNTHVPKAELGNYQLALQMLMIFMIFPQAASLVLYSKMAATGPDGIWQWQKRLMCQVLFVMLIAAVIAHILAGPMIRLVAGPRFEEAVHIFQLMLPNLAGLTLAQLMTCQWIGRGIFFMNTLLTMTIAVSSIAINMYLIRHYGSMGAVWANWISYVGLVVLSQLSFMWWCEKRYRGKNDATAAMTIPMKVSSERPI